MSPRKTPGGQVLVLFTMFLLVLLGISALAIDYATWLLTDRSLQNTADHAALAGASQFEDRTTQGACTGGLGQQKCNDARAQMWTALNDELDLSLTQTMIACLATAGPDGGDSPANGEANSDRANVGGCTGEASVPFGHRIWVTTPPPDYDAYTEQGGKYAYNFGITYVRVDRDVRSFLGGALGIQPDPRHGWATAGALPSDYALQLFCRNHVAPEDGVCVNSAGLTIDGQGGIQLIRGDIASNESLTVTSQNSGGVILLNGNMFLVNRTCANSTWNCPNSPPLGGISDGVNGKNAFYMAPLPVPHYESPLDVASVSHYSCNGASASDLCIPYKSQTNATPNQPGDWECIAPNSGSGTWCGAPTVVNGTVSCVGTNGGGASLHYYPTDVPSGASAISGDAGHPQSNRDEWQNIDDDYLVPDTDTQGGIAPVDWVYTGDINVTGGGGPQTTSFTVSLGAAGFRQSGSSTVRYTVFKTFGGVPDNTQNAVTLQVSLLDSAGTVAVDPTIRTLNDVPALYAFDVGAGLITDYNSLRLRFTFTSQGSTAAANERGGAVSWAGIQHPEAQPPLAPPIPPGYYRSIVVADGGCAVLDPTAEFSNLKDWQMPGIYRFGGSGSNNDKKIKVGDGSFLIGDGVTLVFDSDWPNSGSNQGVAIGANGALVLNTMRVPGVPPCTPDETEALTVNMSATNHELLPYSAVCAAWAIDQEAVSGIRQGQNAWHACDFAYPDSGSDCVDRSTYNPTPLYRGITFYFTPDPSWATAHTSMIIRNRFEMQGGGGDDAGIAFRGVMYAPYDDVKISGSNGFSTVGQVLAWTAKFNGGSAYLDLDYPYRSSPAKPYLLEPTIDH